jgi:hypothetical protein
MNLAPVRVGHAASAHETNLTQTSDGFEGLDTLYGRQGLATGGTTCASTDGTASLGTARGGLADWTKVFPAAL